MRASRFLTENAPKPRRSSGPSTGSRDAAIRAQWKKAQEAILAAQTAEEEHAAELAQDSDAAIGDDPLAVMEGETHGTDADAGEYLNEDAKDGE